MYKKCKWTWFKIDAVNRGNFGNQGDFGRTKKKVSDALFKQKMETGKINVTLQF